MKETEKRLLKARLTSAARELSLLGGGLDDEAAITQIRNRILSLEQTIQNLCGGVPLKISPSVQFDIYMYKRKGLKNAEIAKKLGVSGAPEEWIKELAKHCDFTINTDIEGCDDRYRYVCKNGELKAYKTEFVPYEF